MEYLFAAYTIIWVMLFGYTISIGKRQSSIAQEIDLIKEQLKQVEAAE